MPPYTLSLLEEQTSPRGLGASSRVPAHSNTGSVGLDASSNPSVKSESESFDFVGTYSSSPPPWQPRPWDTPPRSHISLSSDTEMDVDALVVPRNVDGNGSAPGSRKSSSPEVELLDNPPMLQRNRPQNNRLQRLSRYYQRKKAATARSNIKTKKKKLSAKAGEPSAKAAGEPELHLHVFGFKSTINVTVDGNGKNRSSD